MNAINHNKEAISALIKAQNAMQSVKKDSVNPHFKNRYASLEAVIEATSKVFQDHGFAVMQPCGRDELGVFVETRLLHGLLGIACLAPEDDDGNMATKQSSGVAVTKGLSSEDTSASSGW